MITDALLMADRTEPSSMAVRIPVEVGPDDVGDIVNAFRHINIAGITATKPNKIEIMNYLDEILYER